MSRRRNVLLIVLSLLSGIGGVSAETFVVDVGGSGDYPAIQPALDEAAPGDTILVLAGTYIGADNQNLDFGAKDLLVYATMGPDVTVIDGEGSGGGFVFNSGVTSDAVVQGFTLTGHDTGRALTIAGGDYPVIINCVIIHNDLSTGSGGGVLIQASSPTFVGCVFAENSCSAHGGGILIDGGAPSFTGCMIVGNHAQGRGGGLSIGNSADVALLSCTVTGNRADLAQASFRGGGLMVEGGANVLLERTIIWGNRADLGDDLFGVTGTTSNVVCSDVDAGGFMGGGSIVYGPNTIYDDPHFCRPAYCRELPWTDGTYTLAANSPCLPANSPCGLLIGAGEEGCSPVVVWTGGAGTIAWEDSLNWSTASLPGSGDNVQLTMGNVVLSTHAQIGSLTQCPENAADHDTLRITAGGVLETGVGAGSSRRVEQSDVFNDVTILDANSGAITSDTEEWPWDLPGSATFIMHGGYIQGLAGIELNGRFVYASEVLGYLRTPFLNRGVGGGSPPSGFHVQSGMLQIEAEFINEGLITVAEGADVQVNALLANEPGGMIAVAGGLFNQGTVDVAPGATLALPGAFENESDGELILTGNVTGGGLLTNTGLLLRNGAGSSVFGAQLQNHFDPGTGDRGIVRVMTGELSTNSFTSSGLVTVTNNARLEATGSFDLTAYGVLSGGGMVDVTQASFVNRGAVLPGSSPGALEFTGAYTTTSDSRLYIELSGTDPGVGYDQLLVDGTAQLGGALHVDVDDSFTPQLGDTFRIVTYTVPTKRSTPFDCMSGLQLTGSHYLAPATLPGAFALVVKDSLVMNQAPIAVPDTAWVFMDAPTVLHPLDNDIEPDGDARSLARLDLATTAGQAYIDSGASTLTYWPATGFVGEDALSYWVTDCLGAVDAAQVIIFVRDPAGVDPLPALPAAGRLHAPAPNPFHSGARLTFDVPRDGDARVVVYDLAGRQVQILARGRFAAGRYETTWFGRNTSGQTQLSGVYLVQLETAEHTESRKLTLIR
ncbi:Ig-like domain-containing protein [Candidatus Eisenbacteria bacterium]|uniref:Ig-like domain-containing protein n=1 Tax=Eiseniibacteriota bacterium TaxID=2212470 RepID=A0ABV6YIP0_UNCEI